MRQTATECLELFKGATPSEDMEVKMREATEEYIDALMKDLYGKTINPVKKEPNALTTTVEGLLERSKEMREAVE